MFMAMIMLTSVLVVTLTASGMVRNSLKMTWEQQYSAKAFFAAEAGSERMLYEARKLGLDFMECAPGDCVAFLGTGEVATTTDYHILCEPDCLAANKYQTLSNNATYRIEYLLDTGPLPADPPRRIAVARGNYAEQNRVVKVAQSMIFCTYSPGCYTAAALPPTPPPLNSHIVDAWCAVGAGDCYQCDADFIDCDGNGSCECDTTYSNRNCVAGACDCEAGWDDCDGDLDCECELANSVCAAGACVPL